MGGSQEQVEYPLRTFELMGWLSLLVLVSQHLGEWDRADWACNLLTAVITLNPSARRPMLDEHGIEIALAALALAFSGRQTEAAVYASWVLSDLGIRADLERPLPELYNNIDAVLEAFADKRPPEYTDSSSTLITLLFELLLWDKDSDEAIRSFAGKFRQLNLQTWYPPNDYSTRLYRQELTDGFTETGVVITDNRTALLTSVSERHKHFGCADKDPFSEHVSGITRLIACRHFRTPVFPVDWRSWIDNAIGN